MNKIVKRKLIESIICIILGIGCLIFLYVGSKLIGEELQSYISGFSSGLIIIGILVLIKYSRIMKNEEMSKQIENLNNDERLKIISNQAMAIMFKISVLVEAIVSSICTVYNKTEIATYISFFVCFQILLYLVIYFIISKKN